MIDGEGLRWQRRVLENCAENLLDCFGGEEREGLIQNFNEKDQRFLRLEMVRIQRERQKVLGGGLVAGEIEGSHGRPDFLENRR